MVDTLGLYFIVHPSIFPFCFGLPPCAGSTAFPSPLMGLSSAVSCGAHGFSPPHHPGPDSSRISASHWLSVVNSFIFFKQMIVLNPGVCFFKGLNIF